MWGINPAVIGKIFGSVFLTNIVSGTHGAPKIIRDKIILHVANRDIATAKAMATSVAMAPRATKRPTSTGWPPRGSA
jgi:hypothetical protein